MPPELEPGDIWKRIGMLVKGPKVRSMFLILVPTATLLALYPDEVIRAVVGATAVYVLQRGIGPWR